MEQFHTNSNVYRCESSGVYRTRYTLCRFRDQFPRPRCLHKHSGSDWDVRIALIKAPIRVSSAIEAGLLIQKTMPTYPVLGKAMRVEGTVVLAATISKTGTIENLRAVGSPHMLQQPALDAVKTWRYRPSSLPSQRPAG